MAEADDRPFHRLFGQPAWRAEHFAERLERFDMSLRSPDHMADRPSGLHRLTVFAFATPATMGRLAGCCKGLPAIYIRSALIAGIRPGREHTRSNIKSLTAPARPGNGLVSRICAPFMLQTSSPEYPAWLVEGLAEIILNSELQKRRLIIWACIRNHAPPTLMHGSTDSEMRPALLTLCKTGMMAIYGATRSAGC